MSANDKVAPADAVQLINIFMSPLPPFFDGCLYLNASARALFGGCLSHPTLTAHVPTNLCISARCIQAQTGPEAACQDVTRGSAASATVARIHGYFLERWLVQDKERRCQPGHSEPFSLCFRVSKVHLHSRGNKSSELTAFIGWF